MVREDGGTFRWPDGSDRSLAELISSAPEHATIELSPGRYSGPIELTRPITLRGAGDLTRLRGDGRRPVITVDVPTGQLVVLDSLLVERGASPRGGGVAIVEGRVRMNNLNFESCRADEGAGGAIAIWGGELEATLLRVNQASAERGGALWAGGRATISLRDAQIGRCEARYGGAIAVENGAHLRLEALTIGKARARAISGGQALWISGALDGAATPEVHLRRVKLEDAPLGMPIVVDGGRGEVTISESDLPRRVRTMRGIVDAGANLWR